MALAECCAGGVGAQVKLDTGTVRPELALFHEGPSRVVVSTATPDAVEKIAKANNVECLRIGGTIKERLQIRHGSKTTELLIDCPVSQLCEVWDSALEKMLLTPGQTGPVQ